MSCDGNIHDDHVEGTRLTKVGRYPLTLMAHAMISRHARFQRRPEGFGLLVGTSNPPNLHRWATPRPRANAPAVGRGKLAP